MATKKKIQHTTARAPAEKHDTLHALRAAVVSWCRQVWEARVGAPYADEMGDVNAELAAYEATRPLEEEAVKVRQRFVDAATAVLKFARRAEAGEAPHGLEATSLVEARLGIRAALARIDRATCEAPSVRPTRKRWLVEVALARTPKAAHKDIEWLAVCSLLAGWWPSRAPVPGSVRGVISAEKKLLRAELTRAPATDT